MASPCPVSPSDIAALYQLSAADIWHWWIGARHRYDAECQYRANLLTVILRAGGYTVDPQMFYRPHNANGEEIDQKIKEFVEKWQNK